jgi:hypothetical protein
VIFSFLIVLSAFIFYCVLYYLRNSSEKDRVAHDISQITANDFTVEMDITKDMYDYFLDNIH